MGETVGDRATSRWRKEIEYDPLPMPDEVKVPALIMFGANDPVVPVATSVARNNARRHPSLTVRVNAGADHPMATPINPNVHMHPAHSERGCPEAPEYFPIQERKMDRGAN